MYELTLDRGHPPANSMSPPLDYLLLQVGHALFISVPFCVPKPSLLGK